MATPAEVNVPAGIFIAAIVPIVFSWAPAPWQTYCVCDSSTAPSTKISILMPPFAQLESPISKTVVRMEELAPFVSLSPEQADSSEEIINENIKIYLPPVNDYYFYSFLSFSSLPASKNACADQGRLIATARGLSGVLIKDQLKLRFRMAFGEDLTACIYFNQQKALQNPDQIVCSAEYRAHKNKETRRAKITRRMTRE